MKGRNPIFMKTVNVEGFRIIKKGRNLFVSEGPCAELDYDELVVKKEGRYYSKTYDDYVTEKTWLEALSKFEIIERKEKLAKLLFQNYSQKVL